MFLRSINPEVVEAFSNHGPAWKDYRTVFPNLATPLTGNDSLTAGHRGIYIWFSYNDIDAPKPTLISGSNLIVFDSMLSIGFSTRA